MEQELLRICKQFIEDNEICHPETIYQCDRVIENAYDFIEKVCQTVGYHQRSDDD